ncbi:tripartite tricarboxylate transporter substrate binding protein [soil metagenome]
MHRTTIVKTLLTAALLALASVTAQAADPYPSKPVRIVVPFAAGGGGDFIARAWSDKLAAVLKQPVIIDNRGGGNTISGTEAVAKAAPDGYTLLVVSPAYVTNPTLVDKLPYRTPQDFTPVGLVITYAMGLAARADLPANSVAELQELARKSPQPLSVATSGEGSASQMGALLFQNATGVKLLDVPYKGAGPAALDVGSGNVDMVFTGLSQIAPLLQSKRVKLLATTGSGRLRSAPSIPTVAEQGFKGFEASVWWGVLAPAGTPPEIIAKVNAALKVALADPDVAKRLEVIDGEVKVTSPSEFGRFIDEELVRWHGILKAAPPAAPAKP